MGQIRERTSGRGYGFCRAVRAFRQGKNSLAEDSSGTGPGEFGRRRSVIRGKKSESGGGPRHDWEWVGANNNRPMG